MGGNLKLLVLKTEEARRGRTLEFKIDRNQVLNVISSSGARVRHDSGGRLIVIYVPEEAEKVLSERLPKARLLPIESDVSDSIADLDATESLFLAALKIRTSKSFRDAKKRRKVGETPEEKKLVSGPDVREEY
jgi:hypothetical protein